MIKKEKRVFAIYLPQFHPLPENDSFWGKGFTEWHNVTSAKPLFKGHNQPQLPSEMGFYDLRVPETLQQQCDLASEHGISGFLFYHYWFNGNPLMNKPLDIYLELKERKLPYFFCWANENWTRRWDGGEEEILLKQDYNEADNQNHIRYLAKFFQDEKYVKINGCPVLAIYKPGHIPELKKYVEHIRKASHELGFKGIYLIYVMNLGLDSQVDVRERGFDAGMVFEPSWDQVNDVRFTVNLYDKLGKLLHLLKIKKDLPLIYRHQRIDYLKYITFRMSHVIKYNFKCFPSIFPDWDNSPRRKKGNATIFVNSTPQNFGKWLHHMLQNFSPYSEEENFVVINAWNEWAEGNHLEPCAKWGRQYLAVVKEVLSKQEDVIT